MAIRDESGTQPPSTVRFKTEWSYISTPPYHIHDMHSQFYFTLPLFCQHVYVILTIHIHL